MDHEEKREADNLIRVMDDDGTAHYFELLDAVEDDEGRYAALLPVYDEPDELVDSDGELIVLQVQEKDGDHILLPIEDETKFQKLAKVFEERLSDLYEIQE